MNPIKHYPLRKIAETELAKHFGDLDDAVRSDLATSLVRQWVTNDGYAGLVTPSHQYWFRMAPREDGGVDVEVSTREGSWGLALSRDWHVREVEIAGILHRLNLSQCVESRTRDGGTILLRIKPKEQVVLCNEQTEEE